MKTGYDNSRGPITILLVEDNADIQDAAHLIFDLHWPEARLVQAYTGEQGLSFMKSEHPDLAILDLGLPDIDGMKVLKDVRRASNIPVIILTVRGEESDKVRGLELGADDYIVKPFSHRELLARIGIVMSRHELEQGKGEQIDAGPVKIDLAESTVTRYGQPVKLSATEFRLLAFLASHNGNIIADEDILKEIWGDEYIDCQEYLEAYVCRLQDKLEDDPRRPKMVVREENGYRFAQRQS